MSALGLKPAFDNGLLATLPEADRENLAPHLEMVTLGFRQCLEPANRKIQNVYFLEAGLSSRQRTRLWPTPKARSRSGSLAGC